MPHSADITPIDSTRPADQCRVLVLNVVDGVIRWTARASNLSGVGEVGKWTDVDLECDDEKRETIELFSNLLRLLIDISPQDEPQSLVVEGTLLKLVAQLGERLYSVLFSDEKLRRTLNEAIQAAKAENKDVEMLRIELEFSGSNSEMASWPWEYLRSPFDPDVKGSGDFLIKSGARLVLNRTLTAAFNKEFTTRRPVLLLVVSRPRGQGEVESSGVEKKIKALHEAGQIVRHELVEPVPDGLLDGKFKPTVSWKKFGHMVKQHKPNIVHFIGHGRVSFDPAEKKEFGQLAFVGSDGEAEWISDTDFSSKVAGGNLRLVFLQACESARSDPRANISGVAKCLKHQDIPAVVAMQSKVQNRIASEFAVRFYENLSKGLPIDWVVTEARQKIAEMDGLSETEKLAFGTPVLYLGTYHGLIDQTPLRDTTIGISPEPASSDQSLIAISDCPNCGKHLTESMRQKDFCIQCGLQLRCNKIFADGRRCGMPLDEPQAKGCFCGACGERIKPLSNLGSEESIVSAKPPPREPEKEQPSAPPPGLEEELRSRFPRSSPKEE